MVKAFICGLIVTSMASGTASAARFAIGCAGESRMKNTLTGQMLDRASPLSRQVYVIDDQEQSVQRWMEAKQELEGVCGLDFSDFSSTVSPGYIRVETAGETERGTPTKCNFNADRRNGKAEWFMRMDYSGGRYHEFRWTMTCVKADMPVFDPAKNKF